MKLELSPSIYILNQYACIIIFTLETAMLNLNCSDLPQYGNLLINGIIITLVILK